jgi:transcription elongation GreA/GreB family factor
MSGSRASARYGETGVGLTMDKKLVLEKIRAKLAEELQLLTQAADAAHDAATNDESKAEDQYDTRGLEASYLAGAQAQRAADVMKTLTLYHSLKPVSFGPNDRVAATALVELELNGKKNFYFVAPYGGSMTLEVDGAGVQVITAKSPLGEELIGRKKGDSVEVEARNGIRTYVIKSIQ